MRATVESYLRDRGYDAQTFPNYDAAMDGIPASRPDALVVDVQGVPRGDPGAGFPQFNQWLAQKYHEGATPIIYLLRKGTRRPHFRVEGPVLKKPFPIEQLGEALRSKLGHPTRLREGLRLDLDMRSNTLRCKQREVHLTNIEAALLRYFIDHEGEILHPRDLLMDVWEYHDATGASTLVRAHVSNLRKKLRQVLDTDEQIETIRGKGYRFIA